MEQTETFPQMYAREYPVSRLRDMLRAAEAAAQAWTVHATGLKEAIRLSVERAKLIAQQEIDQRDKNLAENAVALDDERERNQRSQ